MKTLALILAFAVAGVFADGFHRHGRQGRRLRAGRNRGGFRGFPRRGRQEDAAAVAPLGAYGVPAAANGNGGALPDPDIPAYDEYDAPLDTYDAGVDAGAPVNGNGGGLNGNGGFNGGNGNGNGNGNGGFGGDSNIAMLEKAVPGVPGQDYPIYASVPETAFTCDGQVEGGYYADPSAECQVFHICTADGEGGLAKYSFLCPNGTIFNQEYFICDWWFNFDCSQAEALYSRNDEIRAEQEANIGAGDHGATNGNGNGNGGFGNGNGGFGNGNGNGVDPTLPVYIDNGGDIAGELPPIDDYDEYDGGLAPVDDLAPAVTDAPLAAYGAPVNGNGVDNGDAVAPIGQYGVAAAGETEAERQARRFRFRNGRGRFNGRRQGQRARSGRRFRGNRRQNNRNFRNRQGRRFQG